MASYRVNEDSLRSLYHFIAQLQHMIITGSYSLICKQINVDWWECTMLLLFKKKKKTAQVGRAPEVKKIAALPDTTLNAATSLKGKG